MRCFISFRQTLLLILLSTLLLVSADADAFVVVIDAGHGGHDPGAIGKITKEKDLNLAVSLKLGKLIEDGCKDVDVYYTRKTDVFLTLQERANFVNKHNADLFICIHANSADNKSIRGAETFTLGVDKMQSNLNVAMRENSVILLEEDYQTTYQGFDPNSVESYIMFEFMQDRYIDKSLQYASLVQEQFSDKLHRADRGVRQAGFWVLHKSACPSVLIEMGFVSNVEEEKYLNSEQGKNEISNAIYEAFVQYKSRLDKKAGQVQQAATADNNSENKAKTEAKAEVMQKTEVKSELKAEAKAEVKAEQKADQKPKAEQKAEAKAEVKSEQKAEQKPKAEQKAKQKPKAEQKAEAKKASKPVFRVQVFSTGKVLKAGDPTFKGLKDCKYTKDGKYYKYTYGESESYEQIKALRDKLKPKFKDCFIVAFLDGKQILVKDALKM